jgi:hypothetical protein
MKKKSADEIPQMPFDDALRKILSAPPQHRQTPKKKKPQRPKSKRS